MAKGVDIPIANNKEEWMTIYRAPAAANGSMLMFGF
jgi:hypothetical protein